MKAPQPVLPLTSWDLGRSLSEIFSQVTVLLQTLASFVWPLPWQRFFLQLSASCHRVVSSSTLLLQEWRIYISVILYYSVIQYVVACYANVFLKSLFLFSFVLLMAILSCRKDKFSSMFFFLLVPLPLNFLFYCSAVHHQDIIHLRCIFTWS